MRLSDTRLHAYTHYVRFRFSRRGELAVAVDPLSPCARVLVGESLESETSEKMTCRSTCDA